MGIFDFVRDAGEALFGGGDDEPEVVQRDLDDVLADKRKATALTQLVGGMGMKVDDLSIKFRDGRATIRGTAASQDEREKIVLMVGNTQGVAQVDDQITVAASTAAGPSSAAPMTPAAPTPAAAPGQQVTMYTVKSGDTLSKIAKEQYGNAMKYMTIFEANTPMLKDPNKIYPGQVLRIPHQG